MLALAVVCCVLDSSFFSTDDDVSSFDASEAFEVSVGAAAAAAAAAGGAVSVAVAEGCDVGSCFGASVLGACFGCKDKSKTQCTFCTNNEKILNGVKTFHASIDSNANQIF